MDSWPLWKKAAVFGSAAALTVVIIRRQRQKSACGGGVLVVRADGDKAAVPGNAYIVSPTDLAKATGVWESVTIVCSDVQKFFQLDMPLLQQCLEKVAAGGTITAQLGGLTEGDTASLQTSALFAGAVDFKLDEVNSTGSSSSVKFTCSKPTWATGASASLGGAARIDEDELLGEVPAPVGKGKSDCSSQPKACATCSCGRKELEDKHGAEEAKKLLETGQTRSSCGSCYLGDAFRCETCPYKGLPAFKPGSKVELDATDDVAVDSSEKDIAAVATGGKVMLAL